MHMLCVRVASGPGDQPAATDHVTSTAALRGAGPHPDVPPPGGPPGPLHPARRPPAPALWPPSPVPACPDHPPEASDCAPGVACASSSGFLMVFWAYGRTITSMGNTWGALHLVQSPPSITSGSGATTVKLSPRPANPSLGRPVAKVPSVVSRASLGNGCALSLGICRSHSVMGVGLGIVCDIAWHCRWLFKHFFAAFPSGKDICKTPQFPKTWHKMKHCFPPTLSHTQGCATLCCVVNACAPRHSSQSPVAISSQRCSTAWTNLHGCSYFTSEGGPESDPPGPGLSLPHTTQASF
jgi:hypothetical protein